MVNLSEMTLIHILKALSEDENEKKMIDLINISDDHEEILDRLLKIMVEKSS